ncbi:hypothetical protein LRAMOSA02689 [Lichtheimia ramosa]|uniref:Translation initiation factor 3 C-terminal domain-containing protein n=1 Tax=Lichtheimia ramosa TaxID=688394 RepID=A0A077WTP0_9FUNG|nr:hypothetical protein LRAMOSA02689 [Lichtheimia ramosa]
MLHTIARFSVQLTRSTPWTRSSLAATTNTIKTYNRSTSPVQRHVLTAQRTMASKPSRPDRSGSKPMDRPPRDGEITARFITYVDAEGQVIQQRAPLEQVLRQYDSSKYFLVQVGGGSTPVCRLFEKKAMFERQKAKKKNKQVRTPESIVKEIVLGWNVSAHDMDHKLRHAKQFLEKGNKVKIEIVNKKGQVRLTRDEQKEYVDRIMDQLTEYKPTKPPAYSGGTCIVQFEKK